MTPPRSDAVKTRSRDGCGQEPPKPAPTFRCSSRFEKRAYASGATLIAGVDEVGRGALFGPVVAAAVILDPARTIRGLNDSKQLDAAEREKLDRLLRQRAKAWSIAAVDCGHIDHVNIYQASRLAMLTAVQQLTPAPDYLLVDALTINVAIRQEAIVHGDARSFSIAAASILAKVYRDALMRQWDLVFPAYRLAWNKGYSTPDHLAALQRYGPTPLHRRTYFPVAAAVDSASSLCVSDYTHPDQHLLPFVDADDPDFDTTD